MAQKGAKKRAERTSEGVVPVRAERTPFFEALQLEFAHADYSEAGSVTKGELGARLKHFEFGIGAGALGLDYYDPSFFITPRFEVNGQPGAFDLYLGMSLPFVMVRGIPGKHKAKGDKGNIMGEHFYAGGTWRILEPSGPAGLGLVAGAEYRGRLDGEPFESPGEIHHEAEAGVAAEYYPLTIYATETIFFEPDKTYTQEIIKATEPQHEETRAGILLDLDGMLLGAEVRKTPFETGGELSVEVDAGELVPRVSAWGSHGGSRFGNEVGISLSMDLGRGKVQEKARYKKGFGREGGKWKGASSIFQERYGKETSANPKRRDEAVETFLNAIEKAETFGEFKEIYSGKSRYEQLHAAVYLTFMGWENYGGGEGGGSREELEELGVEGSYLVIREAFLLKKRVGGAGSCGNINTLPAELLRAAGMEAYVVGLGIKGNPHVVTIAKDPEAGSLYLVDFKNLMEYKGKRVWPLIQGYARKKGVIIQGITLYGKDNSVVGYYKGPEGKLMDEVAGHPEDRFRRRLLRSKPKKK